MLAGELVSIDKAFEKAGLRTRDVQIERTLRATKAEADSACEEESHCRYRRANCSALLQKESVIGGEKTRGVERTTGEEQLLKEPTFSWRAWMRQSQTRKKRSRI